MPEIPTILARSGIRTALPRGNASALAFGGGNNGAMAEAVGQIGNAALRAGVMVSEVKKADDDRWVNEALFQEKNTLNEWLSNRENSESESYAISYKDFAQSRLKEVQKSAPSSRASKAISEAMMPFINSTYSGALKTTAETKVQNGVASIEQQSASAIKAWNMALHTPNADSTGQILASQGEILRNIDSLFGSTPRAAAALKEKMEVNLINGVMVNNPALARYFATNSTNLDEDLRKRLLEEVERTENIRREVGKDDFIRKVNDSLTSAKNSSAMIDMPIEEFQKFFNPEEAQSRKTNFDRARSAIYEARKVTKDVVGLKASAQIAALEKYESSIGMPEQEAVAPRVAAAVRESITLQTKNPVAWLGKHNLEVEYLTKVANESTHETRAQSLEALNNARLKYQGAGPTDQFLGRSPVDFNLMDKEAAESYSEEIQKLPPLQATQKIQEILDQYPSRDGMHQEIAFRDLVRLGKLDQSYEVAFRMSKSPFAGRVMGALQNKEALAKLTDDDKKKMGEDMLKNGKWMQFRGYMGRGNSQLTDNLVGYEQAILATAQSYVLEGVDKKIAVGKAVDQVLHDFTFTTVNNKSVAIPKQHENADMGRRLTAALTYIPPSEIDESRFPVLDQRFSTGKGRDNELRQIIRNNGFWRMNNDGKSMDLYIDSAVGAVPVYRKGGQLISIDLEALPRFYNRATSPDVHYPYIEDTGTIKSNTTIPHWLK